MITHCKLILFFCFALSSGLIFQPHTLAAEQIPVDPASLEGLAPAEIDSVMAKMSDEQVRSLLVSELTSNIDTAASPKKATGLVGKTANWLHLLDEAENRKENSSGILARIIRIPGDYIAVARNVGNGSLRNFILSLTMILGVFGTAWLVEFFIRRFTANFRKQFQDKAIPVLDGPMRFIAGIMLAIPSLLHISVFAVSAVLLFFLIPTSDYSPVRYVFLAILFVILFHRLLSQISHIFCSPESAALRVLPLENHIAKAVHKATMVLCSFTFMAVMFLALLRELQLNHTSARTTAMIAATLLIMLIVRMIMRSRHYVKGRILENSELNKTRNWVVEQFAQFWHVPAILYFLIIWIIMMGDMLTGIQRGNSAFLMSLLILPLFVLFNGLGQWIVRVSVNTLRIYNPDEEESADEERQEAIIEAKERERKLFVSASRIMSLSILATLLVWVLSLWDVHIPYATNITNAVFESLIALALGLTVWRFSSSYIERKIQEATPDVEEKEESDDEWGAAATKGRSFTLLPMLRKFIASTLLVMVTLVILSSMGVDIGPLLAGAGVVGLAIGFGAQKMVSDVFSGFFYLLDDAFRVGEYITAGSVSGAVESITLRNVMLRHHRGMLQIVPHSELGSITNFMRGGIIVKFNLEFPYDANVDKIRKVIKKVGQAMLKDEEFGEDFIQPVKSAGVRDITGSVMVIRVKFKAQPGTQFVIRREAYRRITDALAAQGIHYAHRKVIVELPEHEKEMLPEEKKRLLEAGAAAALAQQQEDEKKKAGA
jgi:moderate conductance mechanosensitive channel